MTKPLKFGMCEKFQTKNRQIKRKIRHTNKIIEIIANSTETN